MPARASGSSGLPDHLVIALRPPATKRSSDLNDIHQIYYLITRVSYIPPSATRAIVQNAMETELLTYRRPAACPVKVNAVLLLLFVTSAFNPREKSYGQELDRSLDRSSLEASTWQQHVVPWGGEGPVTALHYMWVVIIYPIVTVGVAVAVGAFGANLWWTQWYASGLWCCAQTATCFLWVALRVDAAGVELFSSIQVSSNRRRRALERAARPAKQRRTKATSKVARLVFGLLLILAGKASAFGDKNSLPGALAEGKTITLEPQPLSYPHPTPTPNHRIGSWPIFGRGRRWGRC